jgi:predicted permease
MSQSAPDVYEVELGPFTQPGALDITIMAQDYHANTAQAVRTVTVSTSCIE